MSKRGENIYKRKDGRWEGRYAKKQQEDGKAKYAYVYGKTYLETKKKLHQARMSNNEEKPIAHQKVLYSDVLSSWLALSQIRTKESTYVRYLQLISDHILPNLGKYPIDQISTARIEQHIIYLLSCGRMDGKGGLSPKTVSDVLVIIKGSLEYARCIGHPVNCQLNKLSIKRKQAEMRVLTQDEQRALLKVLRKDTDLQKFGVLLCLFTGLRIGEVCAMKWNCVDIEHGLLTVRETLQRIKNTNSSEMAKTKVIITEPKSKSSQREIPLPEFLLEIAKQFRRTPDAFVLTGSKDKYIEPRTLQYTFERYVRESGLTHVNYHALRHTFATRCIELGFDAKTLSEILGHTNVNITLNRYVHSSLEVKRANMQRLQL